MVYFLRMEQRSRGFTLVELLVVVAIIGLLASTITATLSGTRRKGRDARRAADLHTIQTAIEMYATDNNHYPNTNGEWTSFDAPSYVNNPIINPDAANLSAALQSYLPTPPKDPVPNIGGRGYDFISNGTDYCILIYRTPEDMRNFQPDQIPMNRCTSVGSDGQCTSGTNAIYFGTGNYADGC